jgi:hypothetical protein
MERIHCAGFEFVLAGCGGGFWVVEEAVAEFVMQEFEWLNLVVQDVFVDP